MTRHEFAKKCLKYNLPHIINDTPELVLEIIVTHSLRGFAYYLKMYLLQKIQNVRKISDCYIFLNTQSHENFNMHIYG